MFSFKIFIAVIILIFATVPWFFFGEANPDDEGLPDWFIYSLIMTIILSLFISYALGYFWDRLAGDDTGTGESENEA